MPKILSKVHAISMSPDGKTLAIFYINRYCICIRDIKLGKEKIFTTYGFIYNLIWSPNGKTIIVVYNNKTDIIDLDSDEIFELDTNLDPNIKNFLPNGKFSVLDWKKVIQVYSRDRILEYEITPKLFKDETIYCIAWSPDTEKIAFYTSNDIAIYDVKKDTVISRKMFQHTTHIVDIEFQTNKILIIQKALDIEFWNWENSSSKILPVISGINPYSYSTRNIFLYNDKPIAILNKKNPRCLIRYIIIPYSSIKSVKSSVDGKLVCVSDYDGTVWIILNPFNIYSKRRKLI